MKSVFPSVTDMIRRPRIACRNPRATVSTSGSSGIRREHDQNITPQQPILLAQQSDLTWFSDLFTGLREKTRKRRGENRGCKKQKNCRESMPLLQEREDPDKLYRVGFQPDRRHDEELARLQ